MEEQTRYYEIDVVVYAQLAPRTFTYSHTSLEPLPNGQIVQVSFGRRTSLGVVVDSAKPSTALKAKIKPIKTCLTDLVLPKHLLELAGWVKNYYAASSHATWGAILPSGLTAKRRKTEPPPSEKQNTSDSITLSKAQQTVYDDILSTQQPVLLSGITGSGKTHIYEKLISYYLSQNKSVLYLSPEIFLTQQLEKRLDRLFRASLSLSHSALTAAQRRNIWLDCLKTDTSRLYLGPRSSLFLPIHNLGLIVVDEAHDTSYKQENAPRYQAREVAAKLAQLTGAKLVLGSATHDIVTMRLAQLGRLHLTSLNERHENRELPTVRTVDQKGVHTPLTPELTNAIQLRLERGEQSLLLHNKRGSARRLTCDDCGHTQNCPRCDTSLVFHADEGRLHCHICNYTEFPPSICPNCRSNNLRYHGFGTKQLVEELQKHFPHANIARIDRDEARKVSLDTILADAESGEIDMLVGTQMIAKGLDFPRVTLVGIVAGDELLFGDDFQSRERGVGLIMQAAGRAGRGDRIGEVVIQTRQPDNPHWQTILTHDWQTFVDDELARRQQFHYPPYQYLARINFFGSSQQIALQKAEDWLRDTNIPAGIILLGPAIPNHTRSHQGYIAHIICKTSHRTKLTELASLLPRESSYDIDPISIF
jgi:primosomal protein N' (replication factor Y)